MTYEQTIQLQYEIQSSPLFSGDELEIENARQLMALVDTLPTLKQILIEESKCETQNT